MNAWEYARRLNAADRELARFVAQPYLHLADSVTPAGRRRWEVTDKVDGSGITPDDAPDARRRVVS